MIVVPSPDNHGLTYTTNSLKKGDFVTTPDDLLWEVVEVYLPGDDLMDTPRPWGSRSWHDIVRVVRWTL